MDVAELMEATRDILLLVFLLGAFCLVRLLKLQKQVVLLAGVLCCAHFVFLLPASILSDLRLGELHLCPQRKRSCFQLCLVTPCVKWNSCCNTAVACERVFDHCSPFHTRHIKQFDFSWSRGRLCLHNMLCMIHT